MRVITVRSRRALSNEPFAASSLSRILVVGTSGSGKSTLARKLCQAYDLRDIELDALHWQPGWRPSADEDFRTRLLEQVGQPGGFVIHGNYSKVMDITLASCDTLIWLDYSRLRVMWRVFTRTLRRVLGRQILWGNNRETFYQSFLSKDSIILWAWSSFGRRRKQFEELCRQESLAGIQRIFVLKKPGLARYLLSRQ